MLRSLALILSLALVAGCSEEDGGMTGPSVPSVAGNWNGEFRAANVTASFQQTGSTVTGTLSYAGDDYAITGTVDEFGIFEFGGLFDRGGDVYDGQQLPR